MDPQPKMGKVAAPEKWKELFTVDICQPAETEELNKAEDSRTMTKK